MARWLRKNAPTHLNHADVEPFLLVKDGTFLMPHSFRFYERFFLESVIYATQNVKSTKQHQHKKLYAFCSLT
jgi:hypothetical protein